MVLKYGVGWNGGWNDERGGADESRGPSRRRSLARRDRHHTDLAISEVAQIDVLVYVVNIMFKNHVTGEPFSKQ